MTSTELHDGEIMRTRLTAEDIVYAKRRWPWWVIPAGILLSLAWLGAHFINKVEGWFR
jgi:hypothetical protein